MTTWEIFRKTCSKAHAFAMKDDYVAAVKVYESLLPIVENLESIASQKRGDAKSSKAELRFERAMFYSDLGAAQCDAGMFAEARKSLEMAIAYKGRSHLPSTFFFMGSTFLFSQQYKEAVHWFDKAIRESQRLQMFISKEEGSFHASKGEALFFLGRTRAAEAEFRLAIKGKRDDFEPYVFLAKICEENGNASEAKRYRAMGVVRMKRLTQKALAQRIRFYEAPII